MECRISERRGSRRGVRPPVHERRVRGGVIISISSIISMISVISVIVVSVVSIVILGAADSSARAASPWRYDIISYSVNSL